MWPIVLYIKTSWTFWWGKKTIFDHHTASCVISPLAGAKGIKLVRLEGPVLKGLGLCRTISSWWSHASSWKLCFPPLWFQLKKKKNKKTPKKKIKKKPCSKSWCSSQCCHPMKIHARVNPDKDHSNVGGCVYWQLFHTSLTGSFWPAPSQVKRTLCSFSLFSNFTISFIGHIKGKTVFWHHLSWSNLFTSQEFSILRGM